MEPDGSLPRSQELSTCTYPEPDQSSPQHSILSLKVRERLAVNKHGSHKCHMETFILNRLNEVEGKEKYRVEVSNRFAALEDSDTEVKINTIWETIRENIKISAKESLGYYELKKHKPWFDEGCSKLLDQRKQAKMQWLHDVVQVLEKDSNKSKFVRF
jgi:hypothetical protein